MEKNYINTKLHLYSKRLIELCIKLRAGILLPISQGDMEESAKEDEFLFRNGSFYDLKQKIAYKSQRPGIMVIEE